MRYYSEPIYKSLFASLRRHLERKPLVKMNGSQKNWLCLGVARHEPTSRGMSGVIYILLPFYSLPVSSHTVVLKAVNNHSDGSFGTTSKEAKAL